MQTTGRGDDARGSALIDGILAEAVDRGWIAGCVAAAADASGVVYEAAFGRRTAAAAEQMTPDSVFRIASMTKALTAAAAMQLVERDLLSLDQPAREILPILTETKVLDGFAVDGTAILREPRSEITLRHLLTHTAGYAYTTWNAAFARYQSLTGLPTVATGRLASLRAPLAFDPGTRWEYGINLDIAGRMVEVASGLGLDAYLQRHIFVPLGMVDTGFTPRSEWAGRMAGIHDRKPDGCLEPVDLPQDLPDEREFVTGGSGLYSTAADYLRFLRAIMDGGELDGARILRPETVALMCQNHACNLEIRPLATRLPERSGDLDLLPGIKLGWALSFLINADPVPEGRSAGSLAWGGLYNTYYWLDPVKHVAGIFLSQSRPFADPRSLDTFASFERAVYASFKSATVEKQAYRI